MSDKESRSHDDAPFDEADALGALDPLGFAQAWMKAANSIAEDPAAAMEAGQRYTSDLLAAQAAAVTRALGGEAEGPATVSRKDRRFREAGWEENPYLFALLQNYLLSGRLVDEIVESVDVDETTGHKLEFMADALMDALAPSNNPALNPAVAKKALDTGGASLVKGLQNFADDVAHNDGLPRQVPRDAFTVGKDLATTEGKVVYRNDLMELIQYSPRTETVFETPLLLSPPWINKYYIMDLAPGRSFVEWAVEHGHTVFAISYRNPDADDRDTTLGDYKLGGPLTAIDVITEITGAPKVNIVGLCLGGTVTAALLAYMAAKGDDRVASVTLLNTLVDFSEPGRLGAFTDKASVERLEKRIMDRGYLDASEMMGVFTFMRSNDLVWNYAVNNWLLGEDPPAFDILFWNSDSTRLPAKMHSFYLRSCYLGNQLAEGTMTLRGTELDLGDITADTYILAAEQDHITPWRGSFSTTRLLSGAKVRFVLSSAGHIAGIVNPPSPKAWYRTNNRLPKKPETWLKNSALHEGTWWEDWAEWIGKRSGERVEPPSMGSSAHPPMVDAPGAYVLK